MAIRIRRGNLIDFEKNKLVQGELAIVQDAGELHFCYGAGNTKRLATKEDLQEMLDMSETSYSAFIQLIADLEANPNELTNILNNISVLQSDKIDKTEKGVTVATLVDGKVPSEQLPPISSTADAITYDNTISGLDAENTQDAIDEIKEITDNHGSQLAEIATNVTKYGVYGTGLIDCGAALQTLLNNLPNNSEILFPDGTYLINTPVTISNSNIKIYFTKNSKVTNTVAIAQIFKITGSNVEINGMNVISTVKTKGIFVEGTALSPVSNIKISDCEFYGLKDSSVDAIYANDITVQNIKGANLAKESVVGVIFFNYCNKILADNITLTDIALKGVSSAYSKAITYNKITIQDSVDTVEYPATGGGLYIGYECEDVIISDCVVKECKEFCLKISEFANVVKVNNCIFENLTYTAFTVHIQGAKNVTFDNCYINYLNNFGISIALHNTQKCEDVIIRNCIIRGNNIQGIKVASALRVKLINNILHDCLIYVAGSNYIDLIDNKTYSAFLYETGVTTYGGIKVYQSNYIQLINNEVVNTAVNSTDVVCGIYVVTAIESIIENNKISLAATHSASAGIGVSGSTNVTLYQNDIRKAPTNYLISGGSGVVTKTRDMLGGTVRPTTPFKYQIFYDTNLNKPVIWNGTAWKDFTGTTV